MISISLVRKSMLAHSLLLALVFYVAASPFLYKFTNQKLNVTTSDATGCATDAGRLVHTAVFFCLALLAMILFNNDKLPEYRKSLGQLISYAFYSALLFHFLTGKLMYELVNNLIGENTSVNGCPNEMGVLYQTVLFFGVKLVLMILV